MFGDVKRQSHQNPVGARQRGMALVINYGLVSALSRPLCDEAPWHWAATVFPRCLTGEAGLGNIPMLADNRATQASGYRCIGRLPEAVALAQEGLAISQEIGNDWGVAYSSNVMGPIYMELGRIDEALAAWQRALPAAQRANFVSASYQASAGNRPLQPRCPLAEAKPLFLKY